MDIEQMRIRMGEMAAEIERLQSVIDEANAQDPSAYGLKDAITKEWDTDALVSVRESLGYDDDALVPLYARPIPAQQSCAECGNGDQGLALYCVKCIDTIQQSPWLNFTVMQALATLKTEVLGLESPDYAIQLIGRIESEQKSPAVAVPEQPKLAVWFGSMPESNGRENWTAILHKSGDNGFDIFTDGHTIDRSEYPDRVKYAADCVRWLIGEIPKKPFIMDYDADKRSNYEPMQSPRITEQDANHDYELRLEVYEKARDYVDSYEKSTGYPPSVDLMFQNFNALCNLIHTYRVTEQDADAIVNSAVNFMYETKSRHSIDYWLFEEGRALLDKLNDKSESVGG